MLKVVTLCSGYDSQCLALNRLGIDYELIAWSEIDKYAIQAHDVLFPQWKDRNLGDMTKIDWTKVPDFDLLTYSTPCQSISNAGLQHGFTEGSGTRSSIIWFVREAIKIKKPKYLMLENVAAMVSQKFLPMFHLWQHELEKYGYINYAQVLNAKDYGVPQNRERIFMISKLDDEPFHFPKPFKLEKRLKDMLEKDVDEKYYLNDKLVSTLSFNNKKLKETLEINQLPQKENVYIDAYNKTIKTNISGTITTRIYASSCSFVSEPRVNQVGNLIDDFNRGFKNPQAGRIYDSNGLCPTINTMQGGNLQPKIIIEGNYKPSGHSCGRVVNANGISPTIMENHGSVTCINEDDNILEPKEIIGSMQKNAYRGTVDDVCSCITSACGMGGGQIPMITYEPRVEQVGNIVDDTNINLKKTQRERDLEVINPLKDKTQYGWHFEQQVYDENGITRTIKAGEGSGNIPKVIEPYIVKVGNVSGDSQAGAVYSPEGISQTICAGTHGYAMGNIVEPKDYVMFKGKEFYDGDGLYTEASERFQHGGIKNVCRTLKANVHDAGVCVYPRIRKLTPKECFRLMGVDDKDIDKLLNSGISNSQLYKLAGNSIVVDCMVHLFNKLLINKENENQQLSLF